MLPIWKKMWCKSRYGFVDKVTIGCGPSIIIWCSNDSRKSAIRIRYGENNFLIKKLGLAEGPELDAAIDAVMEKYGRSNRNKYRVVFIYWLFTLKESVYN
jgi:hypothetical protein